ncbi:MAG: PilN domain-containing protein [bacterium]
MIRVNLQPKIIIEEREGVQLPLWIPLVLLAALAVVTGALTWNMNVQVIDLNTQIRKADFKLRDFQRILKEFEEAQLEKKYLTGKRDFVVNISHNQELWLDFLDMFTANMPTDVWISSLDANRTGEFTISGNTYTYSAIGYFMLQLYSIDYVSSVSLTGATSSIGASKTGETVAEALSKKFQVKGTMALTAKKEGEG